MHAALTHLLIQTNSLGKLVLKTWKGYKVFLKLCDNNEMVKPNKKKFISQKDGLCNWMGSDWIISIHILSCSKKSSDI